MRLHVRNHWRRSPEGTRSDGRDGFARLIAGKRIAVVGPALTLVGTASGAAIDGYDLVVRFNETFERLPFDEREARDIGRRCDVVYANQVVLLQRLAKRPAEPRRRMLAAAAASGLRFLVCTNNSLSYNADGRPRWSCPVRHRRLARLTNRALADVDPAPGFRMAFDAAARARTRLDGCYGRTGFIAILDLLDGAPSEMFITGMSFYHGGGHHLAPDAPPLRPDGNRDGSNARDGSGRGHDSARELAVMRQLIERFPSTLRVDAPLAKLLHYGPDLADRSSPRPTLRTQRSDPPR